MSLLQSIRFRLSLGLALVVFGAGAVLVGGIYLWQVRQLDEPQLIAKPVILRDSITGREFVTELDVIFQSDLQIYAVERVQLDAYRQALDELRRAAFAGLVVLFAVSFGTGWLLSGWVLKPIDKMHRVAREITASDLSRRIGLRGPTDELKGLADTFDAMLDRLQSSFEEQRRFVHETSHELRNPLAGARTNLEVALGGASLVLLAASRASSTDMTPAMQAATYSPTEWPTRAVGCTPHDCQRRASASSVAKMHGCVNWVCLSFSAALALSGRARMSVRMSRRSFG